MEEVKEDASHRIDEGKKSGWCVGISVERSLFEGKKRENCDTYTFIYVIF